MNARLIPALLAACALLAAGAGAAPVTKGLQGGAALQARTVRADRWLVKRRFHATVSYPEVSGLPDRAAQARINTLLKGLFPPGGLEKAAGEAVAGLDPEEVVVFEGEGKVTLNRGHLLSVRYTGLQYPTRRGKISSAHPENLAAAVTLDTRTGRTIPLPELFRGPDWRAKLDDLIVRALVRQEPDLDAGHVRSDVNEHHYSYYLTPRGVTFFGALVGQAVQGIEATVPAADLREIASPAGPLSLLGAG